MPNLIDSTFFVQQLAIPQITDVGTNLARFIDEMEPRFLEWLLGVNLYKLASDNNWTAQRFKDIKDGKTFTDRLGQDARWKGLVFTAGTSKKSCIANYVYYWWTRDNWTLTTGSGEKTQEAENSVDADSGMKMYRAWNEMVTWNLDLREFLRSNIGVYPEYQDPLRFTTKLVFTHNEQLRERRNLLEKMSLL